MQPTSVRVLQMPEVEPVTLSEVKAQVGLLADQVEHDAFLMSKVAVARRLVEKRLGVTLVATQYRATWRGGFPAVVRLPAPPLLLDEDHELEVTVDDVQKTAGTHYEVDADMVPGQIEFASGGGSGTLVVEFWAGHPPTTRIDPMIRSAILLYVTHLFENRGVLAADTDRELPQAFETLLAASSWNGGW